MKTTAFARMRGTFGRFARFIIAELQFWTGSRELTLRQLHRELVSLSGLHGNDRSEATRLIALVASDLREAARSPLAGCEPDTVMPISAWRARYAGAGSLPRVLKRGWARR